MVKCLERTKGKKNCSRNAQILTACKKNAFVLFPWSNHYLHKDVLYKSQLNIVLFHISISQSCEIGFSFLSSIFSLFIFIYVYVCARMCVPIYISLVLFFHYYLSPLIPVIPEM